MKGEKCNTDGNFGEIIDWSEHVSGRLKKTAMLDKMRYSKEDSHSGSSHYAASTSSPMRDRDLIHTQMK